MNPRPTTFDPAEVKLGKKLGRVIDQRTLQLRKLMRTPMPVPPPSSNYSRDRQAWPMYGNDRYGDCALASLSGHRIIVQERNAQQREPEPSTQDVLDAYTAVTGFDPAKPETDNGTYMLDALNWQRRIGSGRERDHTTHTIYAYAEVDRAAMQLRLALWLFGGLYLGLWLPRSAMAQTGSCWDITEGPDSRPGSWGGHAVWVIGYDRNTLTCVTWGARQRLTWAFLTRYCDEAYAVLSEDFLNRKDVTRAGFKRSELDAYLQAL